MSVGDMSVGEVSVGDVSGGEMSVGEMSGFYRKKGNFEVCFLLKFCEIFENNKFSEHICRTDSADCFP